MKKDKKKKPLRLRREVIGLLTADLENVRGGAMATMSPPTYVSTKCGANTCSC
ncbi:MAG: hypothetical protein K0V04_38795 [Deltaproteobacteria bacterium]|nr:hypothetical protein [Deltaproteobacteria bacterium]